MLTISEWFIEYLLPLFCDVSKLSPDVLTSVRTLFCLVISWCAVSLFIIIPYKWIKYLLSGGRRKKI